MVYFGEETGDSSCNLWWAVYFGDRW